MLWLFKWKFWRENSWRMKQGNVQVFDSIQCVGKYEFEWSHAVWRVQVNIVDSIEKEKSPAPGIIWTYNFTAMSSVLCSLVIRVQLKLLATNRRWEDLVATAKRKLDHMVQSCRLQNWLGKEEHSVHVAKLLIDSTKQKRDDHRIENIEKLPFAGKLQT